MFARMIIGECISEDVIKEFHRALTDHIKLTKAVEKGFIGADVLQEEDGRMVVVVTKWTTRQACLEHHAARPYRQLVERTAHMLVGDFVVKLFKVL